MKLFTKLLSYFLTISIFFGLKSLEANLVWAQEISPEEFVPQNNNEMTEDTQKNQEARQREILKEKEEKLEQNLEIHQEGPRLNQVPLLYDEYLGVDDDNNLPY